VSNIRTAAVPSWDRHPIRRFMENGIRVSVNSDDPPMFGTDMNNEYLQLHRNMGFTLEELFRVSMDSIETSFLQEDEKVRLRKEFTRGFEALPQP